MSEELKVGDVVTYLPSPDNYIGIVTYRGRGSVTVRFWSTGNSSNYQVGHYHGCAPYSTVYISSIRPLEAVEKRVARKIKLLWNKSNYVKSNPIAAMK
jgi:hypothetical protein